MVYLLPFLAISFGYIISLLLVKKELSQVQYLLSFSGAFLLSITVFELIPEVFEQKKESIGVFIMAGLLLQIILDFFSKGAEHGHVHINQKKHSFPWLLFISLSIHSLVEGFPITENSSMLWGVVIHKIPIAIILSIFFQNSGFKKNNIFFFLILFALMTPLGSLLANTINELEKYLHYINAIAVGVFLHVSTTILFETSKDHKFNITKLITIILGIIMAYFM